MDSINMTKWLNTKTGTGRRKGAVDRAQIQILREQHEVVDQGRYADELYTALIEVATERGTVEGLGKLSTVRNNDRFTHWVSVGIDDYTVKTA